MVKILKIIINWFANCFKWLYNLILSITETAEHTTSAPNPQIDALSQRKTVSQLLFYRFSEEFTLSDNETRTIYTMDDGRKGFIIEVQSPTFLSDESSKDIFEFFNSIIIPNVVVHVDTFASRNIEKKIQHYQNLHHLEGVNVDRRDILKELYAYKASSMREWVDKPMGKNGVKLRSFTNTISILFPEETSDKEIKDTYIDVENVLISYFPKDFSTEKLISTISEFLNPDDLIVDTFNDKHQQINHQMSSGSSINLSNDNGSFKLGEKWYGTTLTTAKFPEEISAFEFQSAFFDPFGKDYKVAFASPFICSLVIDFSNIKERTQKVNSEAQWNIGQINSVPDTLEKKKPILKDKRLECTEVIDYINKRNEYTLKAQWTLSIFENSEDELKRTTRLIKKKFNEISDSGQGWVLKEETYSPISFQSMLLGFPLQFSELMRDNLQRMRVLWKSNNAQIAPLISGTKSYGDSVLCFPDRTGNMVSLDLFSSKKNYNMIIIGPPGSGKSVIMNVISLEYLGIGALVRLIDIGDSYKDFTYRCGGKFIEADDKTNLCLNFFTKIAVEDVVDEETGEKYTCVHKDELTTIVPMIGSMLKQDLVSSHSENDSTNDSFEKKMLVTILEDAVQEAFTRQGKAAGMQTVWEVLKDYREYYEGEDLELVKDLLTKAIIGLHDYVKRDVGNGKIIIGKNFNFFNGVNNLDFEKDLFTFEMEKLTKKGEDILQIVSMAVMHQIANEAYFTKGRKKIVGMDETKILLAKKLFARFIDDFSRRIRKYGGALVLLTQYVNDFYQNDDSKTIFEGASFKIFPEQEAESIQDAVDSGRLGLNDGATELMKSVKARTPDYNEMFVKIGDNMMVLLNKLEPLSYWLFTTNPNDTKKILEMEKKYNLLESEGAWLCGLIARGVPEDKAVQQVISKRLISK